MPSSHQSLSCGEDHPAEGAALNQVTQSISRFGQRESLGHDRFDRAGLKQRDNNIPSASNGRLRLSEQVETPDAGLWHDEICHVNGCLAACGIPQCCEASSQREYSERLAQDFTTDPVDDNVCAVTARDTTHAVTQLFRGGIDDFIESERLRLLCFRMIGRARHGVFRAQGARQLRYCIADRSSDRWCQNSFARLKTSQSKSHLRGEIRDRNTCGTHVVDIVRNQAKVFFPYGNPLTIGSILKSAIGAKEHHARADGKSRPAPLLPHARSFVAQD